MFLRGLGVYLCFLSCALETCEMFYSQSSDEGDPVIYLLITSIVFGLVELFLVGRSLHRSSRLSPVLSSVSVEVTLLTNFSI